MAQALSFDDLVPAQQATEQPPVYPQAGQEEQQQGPQEDPWVTNALGLFNGLERSDAAAAQQSRQTGRSITADQVISPAGAIGRYQIMPGTAAQYGYDPSKLTDPDYNRAVAGTILTALRDRYSDPDGNTDWQRVMIGYNAGPGRADKWNGDPSTLPKETQNYLQRGDQLLGLPGALTQPRQASLDFSDLVPGGGQNNVLNFGDLVPKSQLPQPDKPEASFMQTLAHAAENTWPEFEKAWGETVQMAAGKAEQKAPWWMPFTSTATPEETAKIQKTAAWANDLRTNAEDAIKSNMPNIAPGSAKDMAYQTATGVIQLMPIIAASAVTKDPFLAAGLIGEQSAASQYGQSLDAGRSAAQANMDATFSGVVNGALSVLPLEVVMKPGQTFLGKVIKGAASFGAISVIGESLQIGYDWGILDQKMTVAQALDRVKQAGIVGTLEGAFLGAGHAGTDIASDHLIKVGQAIKRSAEAQGVSDHFGLESQQSQLYATTKGRAGPSAAQTAANIPGTTVDLNGKRVEPKPLKTPAPMPPTTAVQEFAGEPPAATEPQPMSGEKSTPEQANVRAAVEPEPRPAPPIDFSDLTPPQPETRAPIDRRDIAPDEAITSTGRRVPVNYAIVEADHLVPSQTPNGNPNPIYPAELQPRDRTRAASAVQIADIAQNLDPRLLDRMPMASNGAPIISPDGIVESGNARTLAVQQAYGNGLDTAQGYQAYLKAQGYPVDGLRKPMLVRVRTEDMTPEDRQAFVDETNPPSGGAVSMPPPLPPAPQERMPPKGTTPTAKPGLVAPKPIGVTATGDQLFEDANGVRSYIHNGIRVTEPVAVVPTRGGVTFSPPADHGQEFANAAPAHRLADAVAGALASGATITTKSLHALAEGIYGGTLAAGKIPRHELYDALELGVNQYVRSMPQVFDPKLDIVGATQAAGLLRDLKDRLPTQTVRAGEKEVHQQFSTPPDYAYAAAWGANLRANDRILEPSAGTGSFVAPALNAGVERVWANDISDRRADMLRSLKPDAVTSEDAEYLNAILPADISPTVILMNPPFSAAGSRMAGVRLTEVGATHVEQALERLRPGGRLVAIVGKGMSMEAPAFRDWWKKIGSRYDVRANIGVNGSIYRKYGTTFDTRVLVIDKRPPTGAALHTAENIKDAPSLVEALKDVRSSREYATAEPGVPALVEGREGIGGQPPPVPGAVSPLGPGEGGAAERPRPARNAAGGRGAPSGIPAGGEGPGERVPVAPDESQRPADVRTGGPSLVGASEVAKSPAGGGGGAGDGIEPDGSGARADPGITPAPGYVSATELSVDSPMMHDAPITDAVYENYRPRSPIDGAKAHPGPLVQSAAMASVEAPQTRYNSAIPEETIRSGALSDAQLEAIVGAGASHQEMLPASGLDAERRRGYFIGDGTGVGKGREVAGIMLDNMQKGIKKHIWVSEKRALVNDARRDWKGLGGDPKDVVEHNRTRPGDPIRLDRGILFTSYDTLKSAEQPKLSEAEQAELGPGAKAAKGQTRVDQIVKWAGEDFDGVIAFDEAHNLGNSTDQKGTRGVKKAAAKALAGVELQRRLPMARVVYVSATGATEVSNLAYADRLGLWGRGTAFAGRNDFLSKVAAGGIAAMELVARDMKAMGQYIARSLSFDGVEYDRLEHTLTPAQRENYDTLANAWQIVLQNFEAAMKDSGITKESENGGTKTLNSRARTAILSQFWGGHQRFFNQIITSMQMPTVLRSVERDLAEGRQAVLQLVNTNEAAQERALNKVENEEELEDLDMTPRDQLMQMVDKAYPTQLHQEYMDENGNRRSRPVLDSNDNPVHDPVLVAKKEALLTQLGAIKVPDGPLEMLLNHFGVDRVAEVTGRKQRVVRKLDENGQMRTVVEKRPGSANVAEANEFQDGKKPILVFSEAGGTGRSYHADIDAASAGARRSHYLVQGGWRADKAVQGFGRTHRTNQASAPIFHLVTTDLDGQKRFISSIARRLAQLGALTKGERRTGDQGMFGMRDNLESSEATRALTQFYQAAARGETEGFGIGELEHQMGLKLIDPNTGTLYQQLPPMTQFLNRLLSLGVDMQHKVFSDFSTRLDDVIDRAAASGTLDSGVETFRADTIRKVAEQVVHTDARTGAQTRHVRFEVGRKNNPAPFDDVKEGARLTGGRKPIGWVKSLRGNKVFAVSEAKSHTDKDGNIVEQYRLTDPNDYQFIERERLDDPKYWQSMPDENRARAAWEAQVAATPDYRKEELNMITGAVLPIWDRLQGSPKVFRLQTDAGERVLGRVVPNDSVNDTLEALGAERNKVTATPQEVADRVMTGETATLANGWKMKRSTVAGEPRIELIGPDAAYLKQLQQDGVFTERIDWQTRFFVPTGDRAAEVLQRVLADRPITQLSMKSKAQAAYHGTVPDFDKFSVEHIGTGEGNQTYGHGFYTAGARGVGDFYREAAARRYGVDVVRRVAEAHGMVISNAVVHDIANLARARKETPEEAIRLLKRTHADVFALPEDKLKPFVADAMHSAKGRLYTLDLAPKDDEWLDHDKPMSEQSSKVKSALERIKDATGIDISDMRDLGEFGGSKIEGAPQTGLSFYKRLAREVGGQQQASELLRRAGIPGLRYADQMSRLTAAQAEAELPQLRHELNETISSRDAAKARGDDHVADHHEALVGDIQKMIAKTEEDVKGATHNYVVFDPEHIQILSKEQRKAFGLREPAERSPAGERELLAPDTVGLRPGELSPRERALHDEIAKIAGRIVPGAEVKMMRALEAVDDAQEQRKGAAAQGKRILGSNYGPAFRRAIALSLESPDIVGTLHHESYHFLLQAGLLTAAEDRIVKSAAIQGDWMNKHDIHERYPELDREDKLEEAAAEQLRAWNRGVARVPKPVDAIFRKVREFFAQVADHLRRTFGMDATANDIFSRIRSGEVGARTPGQARRLDDQMAAKHARAPKSQKEEPKYEAKGVYASVDRILGAPLRRVGEKLSDVLDRMPSAIHDLGEAAKLNITPMAAGDPKYRAWAKDFANTMRQSADEHDRVDQWLQKNFTPQEQKRMYDAVDIEGVSKRLNRPVPQGQGLDSLDPRLRAAADDLSKRNNETAGLAQRYDMLPEPLENYVPRMGVVWFGGRATRAGRGNGVRSDVGKNLTTTTPQLRERKYTKIEETERAFEARFGEGAEIVHNIRTLNLATRNLQRAIAGRALIDKLKADGRAVGQDSVVEGGRPDPQRYFTIPGHPAFEKWGPEFERDADGNAVPRRDANGKIVFKATPLWVAKEAEGPLRAVLSEGQGAWTKALLALKGKSLSLIMYSPMIHNQVIWGRAFPAAPLKLLTPVVYKAEDGWHYGIQLYVDGHNARNDPELRKRALMSGMDPVGRRYGLGQDITAIAEGPDNIEPGRSWTADTLAFVPGLFDPKAGEAVKRAVDTAGDFWHNTLLWDRIADLQMGLWKIMSDSFHEAGLPQGAADQVASHFANRYGGTLPMEALGKTSRAWANWILFSRSFTLGNLAAYKDAAFGLPRDVQAKIAGVYGPKALDLAQGQARRKAFTLMVGDLLASKIWLVTAAGAVAALKYALSGQWNYHPPNQNEPNYQNRVLVGHAADGTALYMRLPVGKTIEDQQDWATQPRAVLLRKLSPMARVAYSVAADDKGFGRKLYNPNDKSLGGDFDALVHIAGSIVESLLPIGQFEFVKNLVTGKGDTASNVLGAVLPVATGFTLSHGYPGGQAQGEIARAKEQHDYQVQEAMPGIREQIRSGDIQGARKAMALLGVPPREMNWIVTSARNPNRRPSASQLRAFRRYGTPEEQSRVQGDLQQ